jgi:ribose/xylose/arabinose/galactoside ABC-type transport system permease subunit
VTNPHQEVYVSAHHPAFRQPRNLLNVVRQIAVIGLIGVIIAIISDERQNR